MNCTIDAYSDRGSTRAENEDAVAQNPELGIAVLADGMGGHNAGDVASRKTVDALLASMEAYLDSRLEPPTLDEARDHLTAAIAEQNRAIFDEAASVPALEGMGCTLVVTWLLDAQALVANVGDSRCYHLRDQTLTQVTRDHSFVQFQIDNGLISETEARSGGCKNYLLRSIGSSAKVSVDFFVVDLAVGDILLAVSDGITEAFDHPTLHAALLEALRSNHPSRTLVEAAVKAGSRDNVSAQLIRVERSQGEVPQSSTNTKKRRSGFWHRVLGKRG